LSGATNPQVSELIRKLLALAANNPNREEAAAAYQKAQELMHKYGLRIDVVGDGPLAPPHQAPPPPPPNPPRPQSTPPPPPPPNPPRPQSTPQPSPGWSAFNNFEFIFVMLPLLAIGFTVGITVPRSVMMVTAVILVLGWYYKILMGDPVLTALWKNHRRASVAAVVFLGGLVFGFLEYKLPTNAASVGPPSPPEGMRFTQHRFCRGLSLYGLPNDCHTFVLAQGEIVKETPAEFENLIRQMTAAQLSSADDITVFFNSSGGLVQPGIELGELIRRYHLITYVGGPYEETPASGPSPKLVQLLDHGECFSACIYAFAGGVTRIYREPGVIGVHQFPSVDKDHGESYGQSLMVGLGRYLEKMGVDRGVLDLGASIPAEKIKTVTVAEARRWRLDNSVEPTPPAPAVESSAPTPRAEPQPVIPANPDHQASPASSVVPQPDESTPHRPFYYGVQVGSGNLPVAGGAPSFSEGQCRQQAQNMAQQNRWTHAPAPLYHSPLYDSRYDARAGICYVRFQTTWDGKISSEYLYDGATGELLARWGGDQDFLKGEDPANTSGVLIRIHKLMEALPETQKVKP
jgi:hypothetical protein